MNYIYGIDVGFRFTGITIYCTNTKQIVKTECIRIKPAKNTSKAQNHLEECQELAHELDMIFREYPPSRVIVESPSGGGKSSIAVKAMASCVAVLASVCLLCGIAINLITPLQIKKLIRAKGAVEKEEVMKHVEDKLTCIGFDYPYKHKWCMDHVADSGACLIVAHNEGLLTLEI